MQALDNDMRRVLTGAAAAIVVLSLFATWLWQNRQPLDAIALPPADRAPPAADALTATWFGSSMLLFDDGETQILIDAFVTRPALHELILDTPLESDAAAINRFLLDFRLDRLAAIIPGHTHFDHALDLGAIASRSRATVVGSVSATNIARGGGVPDDQLIPVTDTAELHFGEFTVTLIPSLHLAYGWNGRVPRSGTVDEDFESPAPVSAYLAGRTFTIVVAHPQGTSIVQSSAGYEPGALAGFRADVVFLSVGMLEGMGKKHAFAYWQNLVTMSGARRVVPVHFDDFTAPFGTTRLPPSFIDDFTRSSTWLLEFRDDWDRSTALELPSFGVPIAIYADDLLEAQRPGGQAQLVPSRQLFDTRLQNLRPAAVADRLAEHQRQGAAAAQPL